MKFLEPSHTASSVVQQLIAGLNDGSIVLRNTPSSRVPTSVKTASLPDIELPTAPPASESSQLGGRMRMRGEIVSEGDMHIDGSFEGLLQLENSRLTVGSGAVVIADIIAREVVVYGRVKGNLRARDSIQIKGNGSVTGDLTTARIMIEDGAFFRGSIEIDHSLESKAPQSAGHKYVIRPAEKGTHF